MARYIGLGTAFGVDDDDSGSGFTAISLVVSATPPARKRVLVGGIALSDTLASYDPGIEDYSEYVFDHYYEPNETNGNLMTTLFANKTKVLFNITYTSTDVEQFEGFVSGIEPQQITHDQYYVRRVTIQRTGAISYS